MKKNLFPLICLAIGLLIGCLILFNGQRPIDDTGALVRPSATSEARLLIVGQPPERDVERPTATPIVTVIYPTTGVSWTHTPVPPSATPIVIVIKPTFGTSIPPTP